MPIRVEQPYPRTTSPSQGCPGSFFAAMASPLPKAIRQAMNSVEATNTPSRKLDGACEAISTPRTVPLATQGPRRRVHEKIHRAVPPMRARRADRGGNDDRKRGRDTDLHADAVVHAGNAEKLIKDGAQQCRRRRCRGALRETPWADQATRAEASVAIWLKGKPEIMGERPTGGRRECRRRLSGHLRICNRPRPGTR